MDQLNFINEWSSSLERDFQLPFLSYIPNFSTTTSSSDLLNSSFLENPVFSDRPRKFPKTISWSNEENLVPKNEPEKLLDCNEELVNWKYQSVNNQDKGLMKKTPHEHIIAERKRREKLSQKFIALAAIIPGLKKVDKASILGDTINYVKQLEQSLKSLEGQNARKTIESVALFKSSEQCMQNTGEDLKASTINGNISDSDSGGIVENTSCPEIEVRISAKSVLVRIHCENIKGVLVKVLSEMEKLNLVIVNATALPFESFLDITVAAQMEEGISMTVNDLAKNIQSIFHQSACN